MGSLCCKHLVSGPRLPLVLRVICCGCTRVVVIGAKRTWPKFMSTRLSSLLPPLSEWSRQSEAATPPAKGRAQEDHRGDGRTIQRKLRDRRGRDVYPGLQARLGRRGLEGPRQCILKRPRPQLGEADLCASRETPDHHRLRARRWKRDGISLGRHKGDGLV